MEEKGVTGRYEWEEEGPTSRKQLQEHYMVSGSLCPVISFLDMSYSFSFGVRGQLPRRGQ